MPLVEREIELEHVDDRFAEEAELPAGGMCVTRSRTSASVMPRSLATRGTWNAAASGEMCGSRPDAELVTRSIGTGDTGVLLLRRLHRGLDAVDQLALVGPRLVPAELAAS